MRAFPALGVRLELPPNPPVLDEERPDLSTFSSRPLGLHPEALAIAPLPVHWTGLSGPVPGRFLAGGLPNDPAARWTLRVPKAWNGALVVAAAPGLATCEAYDLYWADFLLARGFAFAVTDKGTRMARTAEAAYIPLDAEGRPALWAERLVSLTLEARRALVSSAGRAPERLYVVGVSNGGWLARRVLEERPDLFDGGVEVSGLLWRADGPNLLVQLPAALRAARMGFEPAALKEAGLSLPDGWGGLAAFYRDFLWGPTFAYFVHHLDPAWSGDPEAYDYVGRPEARRAARALECTGRVGKPLWSVCGEADLLVPPSRHLDPYADLVKAAGRGALHRVVRVPKGSHSDADVHIEPSAAPLMPHAHKAFLELAGA
ncbi:MAG: alpha/beta hydrolase [Elusimicrobia bacterium]|nr:alpha/beta hydrolase [Elusimicrobiota bacterium]